MSPHAAFLPLSPVSSPTLSSSRSTWHTQLARRPQHHFESLRFRRRVLLRHSPTPAARPAVTRMSTAGPSNDQPTAQDLAKLYGGSYLGTSIGMSIVSFGVLYALVYIGVDVRSLTNSFGNWLATTPLGRPAALDNVSDAAGAAAIAYVAHKVTSPLRFPLTIAATPFVARVFSKKNSDTKE